MMNELENKMDTNVSKDQGGDGVANQRRWKGWQIVLGILAAVIFWGVFVYAVWTKNMEVVEVFSILIAVGAGIFGTIHFVSKLYQQLSKS